MAELCKDLWTLESESLHNNLSFEQNSSVPHLGKHLTQCSGDQKAFLATRPEIPLLPQPSLLVPAITLPCFISFMAPLTT